MRKLDVRTRLLIALAVLVSLVFGVRGFFLGVQSVRAQEPPKVWPLTVINGNGGDVILYKVQDGSCSVYVVTTYRSVSLSTGQGCK